MTERTEATGESLLRCSKWVIREVQKKKWSSVVLLGLTRAKELEYTKDKAAYKQAKTAKKTRWLGVGLGKPRPIFSVKRVAVLRALCVKGVPSAYSLSGSLMSLLI